MLTLIRCPFHPRVTSAVRHRLRSFCLKCRWQVTAKHAYTQQSRGRLTILSRYGVGTSQGIEFARNSSGNARSHSSWPAESLWTDPGLKSEIGALGLISSCKPQQHQNINKRKTKKKAQAGTDSSNLHPKPSYARKNPPPSPPPPPPTITTCVGQFRPSTFRQPIRMDDLNIDRKRLILFLTGKDASLTGTLLLRSALQSTVRVGSEVQTFCVRPKATDLHEEV